MPPLRVVGRTTDDGQTDGSTVVTMSLVLRINIDLVIKVKSLWKLKVKSIATAIKCYK